MKATAEIKRILLGNFERNEAGEIEMLPKGLQSFRIRGVYPGWQATFFFGVGKSYHIYAVSKKNRQRAEKAFDDICTEIGDRLRLRESENVQAYLCNYRLSIPAVLVVEETKEGFAFTVFTGRSPTSWISRYRALGRIKRNLPVFFEFKKVPKKSILQKLKEAVEKHNQKKADKKEQKKAKKTEQKRKKAEKKKENTNK